MANAVLRLFVSGSSPTSRRAQDNLIRLQATALPADWTVEVIDVQSDPERAEQARILATPTLSLDLRPRPRRIVGDLSDTSRVLDFLGITTKDETA